MSDDLPTPAAALLAAGGAAWATSAFLPWLARGAGSVMSLRDVGDFVLSDRWSTVPRWVGLLAYIVPVCGGLALIAAGLSRSAARRVAAILVAVTAVVLGLSGVALVSKGRAPAAGFILAVAGDVCVVTGITRSRDRTSRSVPDSSK